RTEGDSTLPKQIGRFSIEVFLGEGGFGRVYRASDPTLKRTVALKVVRLEHLDDAERIDRFRREARAAAHLQHPNIVAVFDCGEFDAGHGRPRHYIACAFVAGSPLDRVLAGPAAQRMPVRQAADVVRKLAEALAYAHRNGVIHRDVKPGNVMLAEDGEPML